MRRLIQGVLLLTFLVSASFVFAVVPERTLIFSGVMNDPSGTPLGGIYWIRFTLHRTSEDKRIIWSEETYVAVDRGEYMVELGKEKAFPSGIPLQELFLAVQIDGTEVTRIPVDETMVSNSRRALAKMHKPSGPEVACRECQTAANAERFGGMTVAQLVNTVVKKQISVGTSAHFSSAAGSGGGNPFRISCPPGFVVTGIKGKDQDGQFTSLQLVCSPLEAK